MTQGEHILSIRKTLKLSQETFGLKVGVGKSAISKLEKGEVNLTDQMAKSICREFNVNYDYLIYGEGEMFTNLPKTIVNELCLQYDLDDFDKAIVEMYISLSVEEREFVKSKMKEFVKKVNWDK